MDTFMDKLAHKLNAQEMIKANSQADAEEMDRLKKEVAGYKECFDKVQKLADESMSKLEAMQTDAAIEETISNLKADLLKELANIDENTHKECVKVYRNVQAAITEENKKQSESLMDEVDGISGKVSAAVVIAVLAMLGAVGSLAFQLLVYFHIL